MLGKKRVYLKYQNYLSNILELLIRLYDEETWFHVKRIKFYSEILAKELNCSEIFIYKISFASSLHDIGKIFISKKILNKKGRLTFDEFEIMKKHSAYGEKILYFLGFGKVARNIALYHHEYFNGAGYPKKIKEEDIPLEAKIVSLADVYDALRQKRSYKVALSHKEAVKIIIDQSGTQFDPEIVDVFLKNKEKFNEIFETTNIYKKRAIVL